MATEKLTSYRRKRNFDRTPEPAGAASGRSPRRPGRVPRASSCSGTAPAGCTTTSGSRSTACWSAGRCRRGRRSTRTCDAAAFHVEDHPLDYFDFEGVIPAGRVRRRRRHRVGLGHLGAARDRGPAGRGRDRRAALRPVRARSCTAGSCWCARGEPASGKEQWLLLHKHDEHAVEGWDAEDHPRSVMSGRTNDEVKADPDRLWRSDLPAARAAVPTPGARPRRRATSWRRSTPSARRHVDGLRPRPAAHQPRQGAVPGRGRASTPVTKRDLIRYTRADRAGAAAVPGRAAR